MAFLASKTEITMREYADHMRFNYRKAQSYLKRFEEFGLLERVGAGRTTKYRILRR